MSTVSTKPILILACSSKKLAGKQLARNKYLGSGYWGLVRPSLSHSSIGWNSCHLLIISAEYGLLHEIDFVDDYDRQLTPSRLAELSGMPKQIVRTQKSLQMMEGDIYLACPEAYRQLFYSWAGNRLRGRVIHTFNKGEGIGCQRAMLSGWLKNINANYREQIQRASVRIPNGRVKPSEWTSASVGDSVYYRDDSWTIQGPATLMSIIEPSAGCYEYQVEDGNRPIVTNHLVDIGRAIR